MRATIPVRYVAEMLRHAGVEREAVLARAAIPASALRSAGFRVSTRQAEALHRAVVRASDDELYGYFRRPVPRGTYATLICLLTGCRTVKDALDGAIELYGLFDRHAHWSLAIDGAEAALSVHPRSRAQRDSLLYAHAMLLTPLRTASWLAAEPIAALGVAMPRAFRRYRPESRFLFGVDPEEGRLLVRFAASALGWPIRRTREEAERWTRGQSFYTMISRAPRDSLEARVRAAVAERPPAAALPEVARALGMSRPSLTAKLRAQRLSFQRIKDAVRRDHAIALLLKGASVAEVSERLGFSEPSAFQRAFKSWTGVPPGRYRV